MLTIREKPNLFLRKTTHSVAGADHVKKTKQETKDNKFLRKQTWNAGQSHPTHVLLCWSCPKLFTDKPLKHYPEKKIEKKTKKERESDVWNFPGLEEGSGNLQLKKWVCQRNYSA